ncbi:RNA polymerase subunit sigma [Streptomyces sp. AF1A]|jgi:RNA polymerase sigma-70 factor (ECF subfamily)|uniref:RNA polymerase subunit sigma n=1 Tax=Streptomyces sp. AF1A TaxID=3394350 RepID=UPI0039BD92BD
MDDVDAVPIAELLEERRYLLDIASWMLGRPDAAEDVVDETYHRFFGLSQAARRRVTAPRPWLAQTAGGICLGLLGPPERADGASALGRAAARPRAEAVRVPLVALDSVSSAERAAFLLDDVFGTRSDAVADTGGRRRPECVELADRARRRLRIRRARPTTPQEQDALACSVRQACLNGDARLLGSLLCRDATALFDGGGKVRAQVGPVHGSRQVARSLLTLLGHSRGTTLATHSVNGRAGLVVRYHHQVAAVISLGAIGHRVALVWVVLNPEKLRRWNQPSPSPTARSGRNSEAVACDAATETAVRRAGAWVRPAPAG